MPGCASRSPLQVHYPPCEYHGPVNHPCIYTSSMVSLKFLDARSICSRASMRSSVVLVVKKEDLINCMSSESIWILGSSGGIIIITVLSQRLSRHVVNSLEALFQLYMLAGMIVVSDLDFWIWLYMKLKLNSQGRNGRVLDPRGSKQGRNRVEIGLKQDQNRVKIGSK